MALMSLMLSSVLVTTDAVLPVSPFDSSSSLSFVAPGHFSSSNVSLFHAATTRLRVAMLFAPRYSRHGGAHRSADRPMDAAVRPRAG